MRATPDATPEAHSAPLVSGSGGALPTRSTVAIVGDGLAALRIAGALAASGADVVLLAPSDRLGSAHDARDLGLVTPGLAEHPHRLQAAIGATGAADLHRWTAQGARALGTHLTPRPVLRASAGEGEDADIPADLAIAGALELRATPVDPSGVGALLGTPAFGRGWCVDGHGVVAPGPTLRAFADDARAAGARIHPNCPVTQLQDATDGVQLTTPGGPLLADVAVLAGDWRMRDIDPWCADKVGPVRRHLARYAAPAAPHPAPIVLSAQHGWLRARIDEDGALTVSGARWASAHFEQGETEPHPDPAVLHALDALVAQRFAPWHAAGRTHAWTSIAAHTCDQLPIIGPLPGRSSVVACFGWNGRPWSMAMRAADAVVDGLVHGRATGVSRWLQAHRFV